MAALACALITLGTPHAEVVSTILHTLLDMPATEMNEGHYSKFLPLALGLCYLGVREGTEATKAALEALPEPMRSLSLHMLKMCMFAGKCYTHQETLITSSCFHVNYFIFIAIVILRGGVGLSRKRLDWGDNIDENVVA